MAQLVYRAAALRDLQNISAWIEQQSGSRATALNFITRLTDYCERLASLPGLMGRDRSDLRAGYRSTVFGNYVIFFRYADETAPLSHLYVVNVVHGARDMDAVFAAQPDDEDGSTG